MKTYIVILLIIVNVEKGDSEGDTTLDRFIGSCLLGFNSEGPPLLNTIKPLKPLQPFA